MHSNVKQEFTFTNSLKNKVVCRQCFVRTIQMAVVQVKLNSHWKTIQNVLYLNI